MYTTLIDCKTLFQHLATPDWVVVDCRFDLLQPDAGQQAYAAAHLPGARYADLNRDLSGPVTPQSGRHPLPDPAVFAETLGRWGITNHCQVVVYDAENGAYAVRLWWMLRWLGHAAVALLDGGFATWQAAGLPTETALAGIRETVFEPHVQADSQVAMPAIKRAIQAGGLCVVDARAAARYAGEVEPIDPVAGHIPGALNYPYEANLDASGRFLPPESLRSRFAPLAGQSEQVVHMCGSGVTACHNLLAMEIAGYTGSKLYAGSWSEWVRNPGNPIRKGFNA
ncbi:MAG: sulfurtransferase [Gammaproteobacteria bacterium]|nr:sulfurtransferase [Gammaproteobacteria bacterium]